MKNEGLKQQWWKQIKVLPTVIIVLILTLSLNIIAFTQFHTKVYQMTFKQTFTYVREI